MLNFCRSTGFGIDPKSAHFNSHRIKELETPKTKKTASFEAVFVPVTVELSNLFIEDLKRLSIAYKKLT
jgi:hypothetical protein